MKQIIKDFICLLPNKKFQIYTWRCSPVPLMNGALASLVAQGEQSFRKPVNRRARIGNALQVVDYYGQPAGSGIVVAISVKLWDYSAPIGKRLLKQRTTKNFDRVLKEYQDQFKIKPSTSALMGKGLACKG